MAFAHGINPPLVHRDLCSHSVIIFRGTEDGKETLTAKVTDFALNILKPTEQLRAYPLPSLPHAILSLDDNLCMLYY